MKSTTALLASMTGLIVLAGCAQQNPVANSNTDPAATYASAAGVSTEIQTMPDEFEFSTYEDGSEAKADMSDPSFVAVKGSATIDAAIDPAIWFRLIRSHERRFVVEFEHPDSMTVLANVKIVDRLLGTFNVVTKPDTIDGSITSRQWIKKPLADRAVRKAVFVRHRIVSDDAVSENEDREDGFRDGWSRWRLTAISGVEITSDDGTRQINSVRLQTNGGVDLTVTDPLALIRRPDLTRIPPSTRVHVTATTSDPTDVVVLYSRWGRMRLTPTAPGVWEGGFLTPAEGGLRHVAVNALSHGTLFEDNGPYDSKAWGVPFVVGPDAVAAQP